MFDLTLRLLAAGLTMLAVWMAFCSLYSFRLAIPAPERQYMDPLPGRLKLIWPLVLFCAHYAGRFLSVEYLERTRQQLLRSGLYFLLTPEQFFGWRLASALVVTLAVWGVLALCGYSPGMPLVCCALFGYVMPQISMTERRKQREKAIVRMLPTYLDFITMAVEGGLSLGAALVQAVRNGPAGVLRAELERVNRDMKAGAGRVDALKAMAERLEIREVASLVSAIAQAERSGGSIGASLRVQADQRRVERFQRAEKLAMEAPVKLIFPLVAFIFPATFVVLGFPIIMKFLHEMP